ncbi:peptide/nickel transport system substrate-binding protein [Streptacidiphilus sp. MAP12-20]|uniref:ABC transporter substrate-binding protein n=1 Tax=Streptacidiphilus sp. MAP12-20 TaxID=3156299 RepID=UPI003514FA84
MSALKRLAAISCVGLIAATTACGSSKSTGPVAGAPNVTLKVGSANAYSTLDPANAYDQGSWTLYYNIYQGLYTYAPGSNVPSEDAAKSCTPAADLVTVNCELKPGLKFSNGDPLDAAAVKFSLDRVAKIKSKTGVGALLSSIKSIDVQSSTQFTFHLTQADATLKDRLASGVASLVDPKVFSETSAEPADFTGVVGSGRYKVDSVQFGTLGSTDKRAVDVKLSLNPNYQGAATVTPHNSAVELKYYADQVGTKQALDSKDVDVVIQDLNASDIVSMQGNQQLGSGLQVAQGPGGTVRLMSFNTLKGVFKNVTVRQAVAQLIDRTAIISGPYQNTVAPAYSVMPPGITDESESFANVSYMQPKQKTLSAIKRSLVDAGVSLPVKFTLSFGKGDAAKEREVQMIADQLNNSKLFQVSLQGFAGGFSEMSKRVLETGNFQAFMVAWSADYLDPDDYISPMVSGPAPGALYNGYSDSRINELIKQGLAVQHREDARAIYKQIQDIIARDVPVLPIWANQQYAASQANVTGVPLTLDSSGNARWWLIGKS